MFLDKDDIHSAENANRVIAETYFFMGDRKKGENLFEESLKINPQWGWGWIGWPDQYWLDHRGKEDYNRAEEILLRALDVEGVSARDCIEERLLDLYDESDQKEKFLAFEEKLKEKDNEKEIRSKELSDLSEKMMSILKQKDSNKSVSKKIGRNDPCPCGSGKKYKRCCLRTF